MLKARITLPKQQIIHYRYFDILHDALINAWVATGISANEVTGMTARPWNFAPLGKHHRSENTVHSLIVSTPDLVLAKHLARFNTQDIHYARASTVEVVDFSEAQIVIETDPILPGQNVLGVLTLSPLAIRDKASNGSKRWHKYLDQLDLSTAINHRLSRLAGRDIKLQVQADSLYLRCNPEHSILVPIKQMPNGKLAYVIGMSAPLVLSGSEDDLRFAWYAGLGEKTRSGFGCIGLAEQGVGR
jgi:CRISPR-associated endoribonuclease Cas6